MTTIKAVMAAALLAAGLVACVFQEPGVYRGGIGLVKPGPLAAGDTYSFRFVDKWRISHAWLSGPPEIWPCDYAKNSFRRLGGFGVLEQEINRPFVESNGKLYTFGENKGKWFLSQYDTKIYGTNPEGKFTGYLSFCGHAFTDTLDGVYLDIVEPDPAKGTDEWIKGAQPVVINGLTWLRKTEPIKDWTGNPKRGAAPIETWVLKIPQTHYWMRWGLNSGTGATNPYQRGAVHHPEKHARIVELFHELVRSVKLEPIEPVDISELLDEASKKKDQQKR